jgi:hypothetical protein
MKAHIRGGELRIRLTQDCLEKLKLRDGEELKAEVFKGGVTFSRSPDEARRASASKLFPYRFNRFEPALFIEMYLG